MFSARAILVRARLKLTKLAEDVVDNRPTGAICRYTSASAQCRHRLVAARRRSALRWTSIASSPPARAADSWRTSEANLFQFEIDLKVGAQVTPTFPRLCSRPHVAVSYWSRRRSTSWQLTREPRSSMTKLARDRGDRVIGEHRISRRGRCRQIRRQWWWA